jgi:hypothetical protein
MPEFDMKARTPWDGVEFWEPPENMNLSPHTTIHKVMEPVSKCKTNPLTEDGATFYL